MIFTKARLAFALAAILTTGGGNLALAADITGLIDVFAPGRGQLNGHVAAVGQGTATLDTDAMLLGSDGPLGLSRGNYTIALDALDFVGANNVTSLTIANNNSMVEIAGNGGALLTSNGRAITDVSLTGKLQLGSTSASDQSLGGSLVNVALNSSSQPNEALTVRGGAFEITGSLITHSGDVVVGAPGDAFSASLHVNNLQMERNNLYTFGVGADFGIDRSQAAIGSFGPVGSAGLSDTAINVRLLAVGNSTLTVGVANSQWIDSVIAALDGSTPFNTWSATGTDSGLTAAFGLFSPQRLLDTCGGILIDGTGTTPSTANHFDASDHSLTAINLAGVDANNAAFSMVDGNDTSAAFDKVQIGDTLNNDTDSAATIYLDNAKAGTYKIFDNVGPGGLFFGGIHLIGNMVLTDADIGEYWNYNYGTMVFSSGLMQGEWEVAAGDNNSDDLLLHVSRNDKAVQDVFTAMSGGMATLVDQFYTVGTNADNAGTRFVSRATSATYIPNRAEAAAVLEGAAQIAVAGAVPYLTHNVITKVSDLIVDHNDFANNSQPAYGDEPGQWSVWLSPFYSLSDVDGMSAGRFENGFELKYGGAALGLDYNISQNFRLGLALNAGGGDTDSDGGDFVSTENDFDFFGATLYGAYTSGAFGLVADLGFTGVDSEITQNLPASLGLGTLKSDVESNAFTLGLTGKYNFAVSEKLNIAPHLGLRYTKVSLDDADVKLASGGKVFDTTVDDQNIFQIPLGVEFSGDIATEGGWTITPKADLGVLFSLGDTDTDTRARIANTNLRSGAMNADVVDRAAFTGSLGLTAAADNGLSLSLDYGILTSGNQTDHQFSGMVRFDF